MLRRLLFLILAFTLAADAAPAAPDTPATPGPEVSDLFTITHTPNPVAAAARTDPATGATTYLWTFRTDIHNGFDFPLRIIEFGAKNEWQGQWRDPSPAVFTAAQFGEWYTAADPAPDGWIQPGQTAADANNWNRSSFPVSTRSQWYYLAEDEQGRRYLCHREVVLSPFVPGEEPWGDGLPGTLVPVTIRRAEDGTDLPPGAQVRISRLGGNPYPPHAVYEAGDGHPARPMVRVPGLYRLQVFVPGCQMASAPLVLEADDSGLELAVRAVALSEPADPEAMLFTFDDRHVHLAEVWQLQKDSERENQAYLQAYQAHVQEYGEEVEMPDVREPFLARLAEHLGPPHPLAVRRFAAYELPLLAPDFTADQARLIAQLLPATSPLLAADPQAAARAAARIDALLDSSRQADLAARHPDRLVRGHATAALAWVADSEGNDAALAGSYAALVTEFADLRELDHVRQVLDPARLVRAGRPLPAFAAPTLDGQGLITEATAAGKVRLLHFWASWCAPCRAEMKPIHEVYEKFHPAGLEIISFSLDRTLDDARAYQGAKWHMPWTNAFLAEGTASPAAKALEVVGIPRLVLVDPRGKILAVDGPLRGETMQQTIGRYLGP